MSSSAANCRVRRPLAVSVIRTLGGVHPSGALMQFESGAVGVVVRRPKTGTAPLVATLCNARGEPVVSTQFRDSADRVFAISRALPLPSDLARASLWHVAGAPGP